MNGNTFDVQSVGYGHARKVWREIRHRYPAGGTIQNVSDWVSNGVIPAGTPCKWYDDAANDGGKKIVAYTDAQVSAADTAEKLAALGINGYLQEDARILDANTVATGTVIYAGEIYEYMLGSKASQLKGLTTTPEIVFVS